MEIQEIKQQIDASSVQVQEMVYEIIGDSCEELDNYMIKVRTCFLSDNILDKDLDKILLRLPVFIYSLTSFLARIDISKGVSAEQAKYTENTTLLNVTGTVAEKQAKALNSCLNDRVVQLAFKVAGSVIQSKIDGAMEILASAKKVHQRRLEEMKLTKTAGNAYTY